MIKRGSLVWICVILVVLAGFNVLADDNSSQNSTSQNVSQQINTTSVTEENQTKVEKAFDCLIEEVKSDCSGATTVQQLALTILASPEEVTGECVKKLEAKKRSENCFGDNACGIKETALAILALDHVGKDTKTSEEWLLKQNKTASDVEWFLQQDSSGQTSCDLIYDTTKYTFSAAENKKLSGAVGPCFSFAQSSYWLRLAENCYDKEFSLTCDKKFFAAWHYKSSGSQVINVLSDTKEGAALNEVKLKVNSKCFGIGSTGCSYEDSAWAVLALKKKDYDIKPFLPYLISAEDSNEPYLPTAFSYLILEYDTLYGTKLIQQQKNGQFWEAENSAYGRYYDTALALLALGHLNQEQVQEAKKWIWYSQDTNGCWNSRNIRDTAIILWALEKKSAPSSVVVNPITKCSEGGYVCSSSLDCLGAGGQTLSNYDCSYAGLTQVCCSLNPRKSCSDLLGSVCPSGKICSGIERDSLEGKCCLEDCIDQESTITECEENQGQCRESCLSSQEEDIYDCAGQGVCCIRKASSENKGVPLWLWILIAILILLIVIAVVMRDRIKVWYYKKKTGFKKDGSSQPKPPFGPGPARPGFPPIRRPMGPPMMNRPGFPVQRPPIRPSTNQRAEDTFKKLKEMSK